MKKEGIMSTRKHTWFFFIFIVVAIALTANGIQAETSKIKFGYRLTMVSMVLLQGKYHQKYDLEMDSQLFATGIEMREGIITGTVNIGEVGITPTSVALTRVGKDLRVVSVSEWGGGKYRVMVKKDSPYKKIHDLVGKKVAIKIGSGCYVAFLLYIDKHGLKEKDFKILNSGDQEAIAAMEAGSVDAVIYWEPIVSILEAKGIGKELANFADVVRNPVFMLTQKKFAEKNRSSLVKFLAAFADAQEEIMKNRSNAAAMVVRALAAKGQKTSKEVYESAMSHSTYEPYLKPMLIQDLKENWMTLVKKGKLKGKEPDWGPIIHPEYLEEALKLRKR